MFNTIKRSLTALTLATTLLAGTLTAFASNGPINGNLSGSISVPTASKAFSQGQVNKTIFAGQEESKVKPWVFADVKLNSTRSQNDKLNYGVLALKRAIAYFQDQKQHLKNNDYFIILNTGYIINKDNYDSQKVYDEAKKAILDNEQYDGDTIFTVAFLSGENKVIKQNMWKLLDIINLAPGSSFTSSTNFNVGIDAREQITLGETLGLKVINHFGGNLGFDKGVKLGFSGDLNTEINQDLSRSFSYANLVTSNSSDSVSISHSPVNKSVMVLRYQLVENVNVDLELFKGISKKLTETLNMGGRGIVTVEPSSGLKGVDIPSNIIFDVMIDR